jgi:hypothetical protein
MRRIKFCTLVSFQVLTITKTPGKVIADVEKLQLLCLDGHKSVVALHDVLDEVPLGMFKDGISVPRLQLKYMFQDLPDYFTLPDEKNKDMYDLCKNSIVGGPRVVFHRYHEKDRTFIRPKEYDDPKPCKSIIGFALTN